MPDPREANDKLPPAKDTGAFADRVAAEAVAVRPVRAVLTALAFVFYVLGVVIGALVVAVTWSIAAVKVGVADVRARADRQTAPAAPPSTAVPPGDGGD